MPPIHKLLLLLLVACVLSMPAWSRVEKGESMGPLPAVSPGNCREQFDSACHEVEQELLHDSKPDLPDNTRGGFAWLEAYRMLADLQMYRATRDTEYLRRLCSTFDRILAHRDDRLGRIDAYTSTSLPGWGSASYDKGVPWHVFIVHTGMITWAPAEFLGEVSRSPQLQREFANSSSLYRSAIEECITGAEPYWTRGPGEREGHYRDPALGLLPLNQSNAMGIVLLHMHDVTSDPLYLDHAEKLARFFKNRITVDGNRYRWLYWPREGAKETGGEDISHAAINVNFAVQCAKRGIVFTRDDMKFFARTWMRGVRKNDGTWAGTISGGTYSGIKSAGSSAGRWLPLVEVLEGRLRRELHADLSRAVLAEPTRMPSQLVGLANLCWLDGELKDLH